ncbi:pseudouridine synthase [Shinella sp. NM-101]|uniref:pseudouridine synthase n=1 Tax=Shinella sp. NM-101 TaxID=2744455 RepID=UPI001F3A6A4B|nr:pseudouridine synthase [Shinella sp. NM-101]
MTSKDKPKRPGGKPPGRDTKPRGAASAATGKKSFAAGKPAGKKPAGKPPAGKSAPRDAGPARAERPAPGVAAGAELAPERISKLLARAGVASRRDIERMIMEGRVSVNGTVLDTPVVNATFADRIEVDGMPIRGIERTRLWLYHKPAGLVTTNADPEGRPTVFENLPEDLPRVMSIGRLDINTEGLLLLTNDGGLARMLELPTTGWLRRYRVRAHGKIEQADLDKLKEGIAVEGVLYGAIDATLDKVQGSNVWLTLGLREGKNREVKNVLGALGLDVNRLIRISYGPFQLGELPEGHAQEIRGRTLRDQLGPRLIEEAKANFDAPLFDHAPDDAEEKPVKKSAGEAPAWAERPAERREKPGDRREKARARLDTRRDDRFGDKPRGGARDRDDSRFDSKPKREPATRARRSNVWMAPGARPVAEKKADDAEGVKREPRERPEGAPKTKRYGRTAEGAPTRSSKKFDPDRKGPARGRPGDDRVEKPRILKTRDADGEWIRASEPEARDRDEGGFGRKRSGAGDERAPRGFGDRPPRGDRPFGERKPRAEGERSFSDRPPRRDGGKPFGGKPGGKSFGGKPGGRPSGGKPGGGRPAGGSRPRGKGK